MTTAHTLVDAGMPWLDAQLLGQSVNTAATGSTALVKNTATPLRATFNYFPVVNFLDGVTLPGADASPMAVVYDATAQGLSIFARGAETINALNTSSAFSVGVGQAALFIPGLGNWVGILSA